MQKAEPQVTSLEQQEQKLVRVCTARTRAGKPCPINADRTRQGKAYCHVHDPEGRFQQQHKGEAMTAPRQVPANHLWSIEPGTKPSVCRSCGATIYWIKTNRGKNMPVDVEVPGGHAPDDPLSGDPEGYGLGYSHFATCPNADEHRRPR